jgi:Ca-activated chloride channel family protein
MELRPHRLLIIALTAIIGLSMLPATVRADGVIIVEPPPCDIGSCPPVPVGDQLNIRSHRVDVTVRDGVATTKINQIFANPNDWEAEGIYLFPVPEDAAVSKFTMWVDGTPIEAELLDADEARQIYEDIVRERRDPALLEYAGQAALRARIFPIPPGGERRVEISYEQVLNVESGIVRYVYPLNTERFSAEPLEQISVRVSVESKQPVQAVYSPSHQIATDHLDAYHFVAGWEASGIRPSENFTLVYATSDQSVGASLLSYYDNTTQDGYFMLLASPGFGGNRASVAKDVVVVLDTSGSMEGEKLRQAKTALTYVLDNLNPEDRFALIEFSTGVRAYDAELQDGSDASGAIPWVSRLNANGGTDINQALLAGMDLIEPGRPTTLLFLTDGLPTEGQVEIDEILANTRAAAPDNVRFFAFGVGDDVDTVLLDSLAADHQGLSTYVRPGEPLDETIATFWAKVGAPVLVDLELEISNAIIQDVHPSPLPDLYAGSQLVVTGRYSQGGPATVTLRGEVNGETKEYIYDDQTLASAGGDDFVPRLWATRRIGYLLTQIRLNGEDPELVQAVVDLSVEFGIVTPYTSYLITEDDILSQTGRQEAAERQYDAQQTAPASTSGQAAVDEAADTGQLSRAESAAAPAAEAAGQIQYVGARAFVLLDGVWTETTFDPDAMTPEQVVFGSEAYFALLESHPPLADAFALGDHVIALSNGQAYEVVPEVQTESR